MTDSKPLDRLSPIVSPPRLGALARPLGRRGWLILLGVVVLGLGAALNWDWLVAVGLAPFLVGVLPCLAMCALGLCMSPMGARSPEKAEAPSGTAGADAAARATGSCCSRSRAADPRPADVPPR
jgi:hypothetical protein